MKTQIIKKMRQSLQESGLPLTVSAESSSEGLVVEVHSKKLNGKLLVGFDSANKSVRLTFYFQEQTAGETKGILYETLNELNVNLPVGHFCIDPHSGAVIMQTSYFLTGDFDPAKFRLTVGGLLGEGAMYLPLIKKQTIAEPPSV